jgi:hypothetical protein
VTPYTRSMPSARALTVTLLVCVVIAIGAAFTLIAMVAEGVALLALIGLVARRVHEMNRQSRKAKPNA